MEEKPSLDTLIDSKLAGVAKMLSEATSILIFLVGILILIGWKFNILVLTSISPYFAPMTPNAAVGLLFLGSSLWLLQEKRSKKLTRNLGQWCAILTCLLGLLALAEYAFGKDLFIDNLLFHGVSGSGLTAAYPGRIALGSALIFIFLGVSLLLLDAQTKRKACPAQFFSVLAGIISIAAIVGYVHNIDFFYQIINSSNAMSLYSAMVFFMAHFGVLLARPERGWVRVVVSSSFIGKVARFLFPLTFIGPLVLSWLVEYGEHNRFYNVNFGIGLETAIDVIGFFLIVWVGVTFLQKQEEAKIKTDRRLLENEARYHSLVDTMSEGLGVQDKNGIITFLNKRACEMLGYKLQELVGRPTAFVFDKENQKILREQMIKRRKGGRQSYEIKWLRKDGKLVDTIISPTPLFDANGEYSGAVAVFTDISEHKKAEISELRYRRLFEAAKDGILLLDFNTGMIVEVNQFLMDLLGYPKSVFLKKYLWDIGVLKDVIESKDKFLELQTKKYVHYENLPLETKEGKKIAVEFVSNVYDVAGQKIIQCNIRDITDRVRAEEEVKKAMLVSARLAQDLEKFKRAVDGASDHIIITDPEGVVLYLNKAAEIITGYTPVEAIGKKAGKVWGGYMPKDFYEKMWHTIKTEKKPFIGEIVNRRKNGEDYTVELRISPILNKDGQVEFFVGIERDISQAKQIERMKTDFMSFTSHQLRTPLTVIKWNTEMIQNGDAGKLTAEQKKYLNEIERGEKRMAQLINSLLNVSRLESSRVKIEPKSKDLVVFISEIISEVSPFANAKNCAIIFNKPDKLPLVNVDPVLFKQIFFNLLNNASHYSKPGKCKIEIDLKEIKGYYQVDVTDEGIGIPIGVQDKIFSKFFRADNAIKADTEGTGLGLFMTKLIVEASGGKIWFESTEGKGSAFHFTIPKSGMRKMAGEKSLSA